MAETLESRVVGRPALFTQPAVHLVCSVVLLLIAGPTGTQAQATEARSPGLEWGRQAAADYLDSRASWWMDWSVADRDLETSCVSCHTTLPYALARPELSAALGETDPVTPQAKLLSDVGRRVALWNSVEPYYPDQTVGLPKTSESRGTEAILNALILSNRDARAGFLTSETRQAFDHLWKLQFTRGDASGSWAWLYFGLAPWESSGAAYFGAALAAVAVGIAPDGYATSTQIQDQLALLRAYLLGGVGDRPAVDGVMLLWADGALGGLLTAEQRGALINTVVHNQNTDGGWSLATLDEWEGAEEFSPGTTSDGYATGLVALALQKSGVAPDQPELARGLKWLVENQDRTTGLWPGFSLNRERDPASDRGRFMADAATAFAVLALSMADHAARR